MSEHEHEPSTEGYDLIIWAKEIKEFKARISESTDKEEINRLTRGIAWSKTKLREATDER
jgi:hypothetical protein